MARAFPAVVVPWSLALPGCLKSCAPQPGAVASEAAPATSVAVTAAEDSDARAESTSAPSSLPRNPPASDALALVAVGAKPGAKIVWLQANGSRVWLSGMGLDAYADADGPLVPAPDLLSGMPHAPDDRVIVVGAYPNLLAYRARNEYCAVLRHPALFVRDGNGWKQGQALSESTCPAAFVAWNGGALLVESAVNPVWATGGAGPVAPGESGTTLRFVAADGSVRPVDLALPRAFEAWDASSDGTRGFSSDGTRAGRRSGLRYLASSHRRPLPASRASCSCGRPRICGSKQRAARPNRGCPPSSGEEDRRNQCGCRERGCRRSSEVVTAVWSPTVPQRAAHRPAREACPAGPR